MGERAGYAVRNGGDTVVIPGWAFKLFGIVQPIIAGVALWAGTQLWSLNQQVTILTVQMQAVVKLDDKIATIQQSISRNSERLSRLEAVLIRKEDERGHP